MRFGQALSFILLCGLAGPAWAQPRPGTEKDTIELSALNGSAFVAMSLFVWPVGTDAPGPDRLGRDTLPAGRGWPLVLPRSAGCRWRVVGTFGDAGQVRPGPVVEVDACAERQVTFRAPGGIVRSGGTGWVVSAAGHVITNHHVVQGCGGIGLRQGDSEVRLEIISTDEQDDLALLRSPRPFGPPLPLREANRAPRLAEPVMALGYRELFDFGGQLLALTGRVVAREGQGRRGLVNATNPNRFLHDSRTWGGNSGGPLLDASGAVLGVHVARTMHPEDKDNPVVPLAVGIRIERVYSLLSRHGVSPVRAEPRRAEYDIIAADAADSVLRLLCFSD